MTNVELIAKIKAEIERLIEEIDFDESANLYSLLSFLSTLEEQAKEVRNPIFDECVAKVDADVREEVRENIDRMLEDDSLIEEIKNFIEEYGYERGEDKLLIAIVARHFYELGCRRTAEKYDEIEYNRQRAEQRWLEDRDGCFWDGVNEGKKAMEKQMLDEARNHFVYNILSGNDMKKMIEIYNDEADCRPGDVVRVIIVKED